MHLSSSQANESATGPATLKAWLAVLSVSLGAFVVVTSEFLPIGLLTNIADGLKISAGTAGLMVSIPGIVAAIAAPVMMIVAGKLDQELHADLIGVGTSIGWQTRSSSIALSFTFQGGKGKMQVSDDYPDDVKIQDVSIRKIAVSLTGSARY